jgi:hypothetical protein
MLTIEIRLDHTLTDYQIRREIEDALERAKGEIGRSLSASGNLTDRAGRAIGTWEIRR